jgi:ATP-dependent DNA ligase
MNTTADWMKYRDAAPAEVESALSSPTWAMEQKHDGTRVRLRVSRTGVRLEAGKGTLLKHSAATQHQAKIAASLERLRAALTCEDDYLLLEGELMIRTGEVHLFDAIEVRLSDQIVGSLHTEQWERRALLEGMSAFLDAPVSITRSEATEESKRAMLASARAAGVEGVVLKDTGARYQPGKRVTSVLKVKFVKTADVIVTAWERPDPQHGSASFAVIGQDGTLQQIGACSLIGKPAVEVGTVIEVAYLYRETGDNGRLVQPRMTRVRWDKAAEECLLDQFPTYSRAAL